jgi:tRNA A37 threonylcarbamoyladenosine synthetase subunit TsaC/SUA5/YrdC
MAAYYASLSDPQLVALINAGAIGIIPTDTVYGLVGRADHPEAIAKLYHVKDREQAPGTIIAHSVDTLSALGFPLASLSRATRHWQAFTSLFEIRRDGCRVDNNTEWCGPVSSGAR